MKKKVVIVLILMMISPVLSLYIDGGFDEISSYQEKTESLAEYYTERGLTYTQPYNFYSMGTSSHALTLSEIGPDDVYVRYGTTWYKAIFQGTGQSGFVWYRNVDGDVIVLNKATYDSFEFSVGGGVYDSDFWYDADEIRIQQGIIPIPDILDFYGSIFFNDPDYDYPFTGEDLSLTRVKGWTYDPNDDTAGYSALDIGLLIITDGLFGMIPRVVDDELYFPLLKNMVNVGMSGLEYIGGGVSAGFRMLFNMIWPDGNALTPVDEYSFTYYEIGNWDEFRPNEYRYMLSGNALWGTAIITSNVSMTNGKPVAYMLTSYRMGIYWGSDIVYDTEMLGYKSSTNDFE